MQATRFVTYIDNMHLLSVDYNNKKDKAYMLPYLSTNPFHQPCMNNLLHLLSCSPQHMHKYHIISS